MTNDEASRMMNKAVSDAMKMLAARREEYVRAWIAATGLHPTECQLVETQTQESGVIKITVRVEPIGR